ncbi:MAG: hypothetical protein SCM11_06845 [Bacillota bacterium]|nr:hypothetical protein [Bacillota bacterium]
MIVSAWQDGTYGIRVGKENAQKWFQKDWKSIEVEINGRLYTFDLSPTFWTTNPEFREGPIPHWLEMHGYLSWPKRNPPKFELIVIEGNRFRLIEPVKRRNKKAPYIF